MSDDNKDEEWQEAYDAIPAIPYGELTDDQYDTLTQVEIGRIVGKRALQAAFSDENDPGTCIVDMLANMRHVCDALGLDFGSLDDEAYGHYTEEVGESRRAKEEA